MPFGIWCRGGSVFLGCHNRGCAFGTTNQNGKGNNILDFIIHCGDAPNFDGALRVWCKCIGIEWHEANKENKKHVVIEKDFCDPKNGLFFAIFNGKYKHKYGGKVAKFKRLLNKQCRCENDEILNEVWCRTKEEFDRSQKEWNATYLGDVVYTQVRSFYREMLRVLKHWPKPFSSLSRAQEGHIEQPADAASYRKWLERLGGNGFSKTKAKQAIQLAQKQLSDVEMRTLRRECTLRQAQEETGVPFNTIKYRKDKKVEDIRKRLGIKVQRVKKARKKAERVERQDNEKANVLYTKIYTAEDYSQEYLRKLISSCK